MVRDSVITGDDFSAAFDKVRYLLNLSTLILVKARVLARSSNYGDAITWCVHALKLATIIRNGGLVTDMLTASTLTKSAIECMRFFRRALTIQSMENLIDELEQHLDQLEPFADILARDQVFEKSMPASDEPFDPNDLPLLDEAECGISHEDQQVFRQMVFEMSQTPDESRHLLHEQTDNMTIALLRLLIVDLKVRLFEDENGYLPDSLLELPIRSPRIRSPTRLLSIELNATGWMDLCSTAQVRTRTTRVASSSVTSTSVLARAIYAWTSSTST